MACYRCPQNKDIDIRECSFGSTPIWYLRGPRFESCFDKFSFVLQGCDLTNVKDPEKWVVVLGLPLV